MDNFHITNGIAGETSVSTNILKENLQVGANRFGIPNDSEHKIRMIQEWLSYNLPEIMKTFIHNPGTE